MDSPQRISISIQQPHSLSPSNSRRRRRSSDSSSPDFEFWMVRNPSFPQPNLLSADQLFSDGVLRPLHLLHLQNADPDPAPEPKIPPANATPADISPANVTSAEISPASITATAESGPALSASKRWKDLFKKGEKKASTAEKKQEEQSSSSNKLEKERKREKKSQGGGASTSAELNINIWPFSRSRSAGNSVTRPKLFPGAPGSRKVSSAPCSRSNSAGESKSRKWPSSPGRPGVHLGRSSPVWQVRRGSGGNSITSGPKSNHKHYLEPPPPSSSSTSGQKSSSKKEVTEPRHSKRMSTSSSNNTNNIGEATTGSRSARVLNMNVPTCIGYRHNLGCRSNQNGTMGIGGGKHGGATTGTTNNMNVGGGNNIFNFRSLFSKKVY